MPRYTIIITDNNYTLEKDNINNTYMVMKKCIGFKQQVSRSYIYYKCAVNKLFELTHNY